MCCDVKKISSLRKMTASPVYLLPLSGLLSTMAGFFAIVSLAFQYPSATPKPAESAKDYVPVVYVTAAAICMLYTFFFNQSVTVFWEFSRLNTEYENKKILEKPSFKNLKYGSDNRNTLAAARCSGNFLEQLLPFFFSIFGYATYISVEGAAKFGWWWLFFRSYYLVVFKMSSPAIFLSTLPAYSCIWFMMGSAVHAVAIQK
jgi:hypothetical protein